MYSPLKFGKSDKTSVVLTKSISDSGTYKTPIIRPPLRQVLSDHNKVVVLLFEFII